MLSLFEAKSFLVLLCSISKDVELTPGLLEASGPGTDDILTDGALPYVNTWQLCGDQNLLSQKLRKLCFHSSVQFSLVQTTLIPFYHIRRHTITPLFHMFGWFTRTLVSAVRHTVAGTGEQRSSFSHSFLSSSLFHWMHLKPLILQRQTGEANTSCFALLVLFPARIELFCIKYLQCENERQVNLKN